MLKLFSALSKLMKGEHSDAISTVSTLSALMEGVNGGTIRGATLKKKGDFGLGTFDGLDGELIMLDNVIYQAPPDMQLSVPDANVQVAYAVVKFFTADVKFDVSYCQSMQELSKRVAQGVQRDNVMLAIKVTGEFESLKLRAVPKQQEPYPKFTEVAKHQSEKDFHDIRGTLIGFRFPQYTGELSVPGFHYHFVSEDRKLGGHVLNCSVRAASVECDISRELHANVPDSPAFDCADMDHDHGDSIAATESK